MLHLGPNGANAVGLTNFLKDVYGHGGFLNPDSAAPVFRHANSGALHLSFSRVSPEL
jgi:hypothetical protein